MSTFIVDCSVTSFRTKLSVAGVAPTSDVRALTIFLLRLEEIASCDVGMVCSGIICKLSCRNVDRLVGSLFLITTSSTHNFKAFS